MSDTVPYPSTVDAQLVVNDLLDQIKRLTYDNAVLRARLASAFTDTADTAAEG